VVIKGKVPNGKKELGKGNRRYRAPGRVKSEIFPRQGRNPSKRAEGNSTKGTPRKNRGKAGSLTNAQRHSVREAKRALALGPKPKGATRVIPKPQKSGSKKWSGKGNQPSQGCPSKSKTSFKLLVGGSRAGVGCGPPVVALPRRKNAIKVPRPW